MPTKRRRLKLSRDYVIKPPEVVLARVQEAATKIIELQSKAETDGQQRSDTYEHMINLFKGEVDLGIPASRRYVTFDAKSSKPSDIILRVMGMLIAPLRCQYISPSTKPADQETADTIEAHLNALYPSLFRKNGVRFDMQALFWQLLVGAGYIQQSYDAYAWDKSELRRKPEEKPTEDDDATEGMRKDRDYNDRVAAYREHVGPPIVVESIDPRAIWPVETNANGPVAWVKKYRVQRFELMQAFAKRNKKLNWDKEGKASVDGTNGTAAMQHAVTADVSMIESVDYYEYIDDACCYYVIGDQVVDRYEHKGGIKIFPAYGFETGFTEPQLAHLGLLWSVRNQIVQLDFNRTLWANKAYIDVFPQLFSILGKDDDPLADASGAPVEWSLEPGTVKQIRGELRNALKDAGAGMDFRAFIQGEADEIDMATISGIARGQGGAQQPGYAINQLSQSMRTQWKPIIISRELQYSRMYEHYLWMAANIFQADSSVFAEIETEGDDHRTGTFITLKRDDIDDFFRVEATLQPDLPIDQQGNINLQWMLYKEGGQTWGGYVRDGLGKPNPIAMRRQIQREALEREAFPKIIEDVIKLGRIEVESRVLKAAGFPDLNPTFSQDLQALRQARSAGPTADGAIDPATGQPMPPAAPAGAPPPPAAPAGAPPPPDSGGTGVPPTAGANPSDSAPGPRPGDPSSGLGLR